MLTGYRVDPRTGAWTTLPWPDSPEERVNLARLSLGPGIIRWAEGRTEEPGLINYQTGEPWRFTPGQKRFIILWWLVDPEMRRLHYRRAVKRGAKGTGKDPFAAALINCELLAPVELYDIDDKTGTPIGRRRGMPLVQISSNSEAQSKDLLRVANAMLSKEARAWYNIDAGETRTILKDSFGRVEVNVFSEASSEGDPVTAGFINESHHMTTPEGHRTAAVARRNVAKSPAHVQARVLELTNAHQRGAESVAEGSMRAWQNQLRPGFKGRRDILYDSIEAPPTSEIITREGRIRALKAAYSDAPWADIERLADEMTDDDLSVAAMIRYYLNGLASAEDAWVDPDRFDALAANKEIGESDAVALFLDCSKSEDATALVGCRLKDMHVFTLGVWQQPEDWSEKLHGKWRAPREDVDGLVRQAKSCYRVVWFGVDPSPARDDHEDALYWAPLITKWEKLFQKIPVYATTGASRSPILFDMRSHYTGSRKRIEQFTRAADMVRLWVDEEENPPFSHDGNFDLRQHVHRAKRRPNEWGISLGKVSRDSKDRVDLAVAMVGAVMGANIALRSPDVRGVHSSSGTNRGRASGRRPTPGRSAGRRTVSA